MATVEMTFTPLPAHVRTARLVATAVARRSGVAEALLDEVRLAVGEACSRAVEVHQEHCPAEPVRVALTGTEKRFEVVDVEGEIDVYTAPRLRELLIDLVNNGHYQLVVNMEKVEFLDSTGLGVLVGGLKRVRAHDGSLDLVCTQERILKIFRITGLTKVFGIHDSVDEAIAARKSEK